MVKLAKTQKKEVKEAPAKKKAPPPKQVEVSSEEDSEEDDEEEVPPPPPKVTAKGKKNATPAKAVKNGKAAAAKQVSEEEEDSEEDDEESEEEPPPPKKAAKATPAKGAKATPAKGAKATPAKAPAKKEESEDDDDEDDESEEEEAPPPKKATPAKPASKATPAKAAAAKAKAVAKEESEDDEDDDDDDEDDEEEEEEMDTTPAPAKKTAAAKAKDEDEDDDDEEEDDDDDEEEDDEEDEDEEAPVTPGKRKADGKKDKGTPPPKKAKSDGEAAFSLFMGNLNSDKSYEELKEATAKFFKKESLDIQEVRLGGSKKFGYVDFNSEEDLVKALALNGKKFLGLAIKLDRAKSKEDSQESKKERDARTLFVKNLPYSVSVEDLKDVFDQALDIRVPIGQNGTSRGIAYVEFKTEAIAEKVLEETQGSDVQGRSIMVDFTGSKSRQGGGKGPASGPANKVLVVNNLAFSATEDSLQSVFEKATAIRIPQNNGRPKGYAFLEFESTEDAKEALESLNNTDIEGRSIRLEYSQSRDGGGRGSGPTKTLFVKGLSEDTTDETLRDSFEGAVAARVATDRETGSSKGYGFIDFDNEEDCKAAKEAMDDGEIDGNRITLDFAKPKGEGGRGGGRGGFGGGRGGRGGFGGRGGGFGGRGGGFRGGRGGFGGRGGGRGGFRGGRGGGGGPRPQGKKIKFDD